MHRQHKTHLRASSTTSEIESSVINRTFKSSFPNNKAIIIPQYSHPSFQNLINEIKSKIETGNFNKHEKIRVNQWVNKLEVRTSNQLWEANHLLYLQVLLEMLKQQCLMKPFNNLPTDGHLPNLNLYDVPFPIRQIIQSKGRDEICDSSRKKHKRSESGNIKNNSTKQPGRCRAIGASLNQQMSVFLNKISTTQNKQGKINKIDVSKAKIKRRLFEEKQQGTARMAESVSLINQQQSIQLCNESVWKQKNIKMMQVLKKVICFLRKEEENLEGQIKYHDLMEKIIMYGNRMKIDLEARKDDLDELSEQDRELKRASEQIKMKFRDTGYETMQFMQYLNGIRNRNLLQFNNIDFA